MPTYPQQSGFRPGPGGYKVVFNVSAATQVIQSGSGTVFRVYVNTAPTAAGGVYDMANGGTPSAANLICVIPAAAGIVEIIAPYYSGLYINPGSGGNVAVSIGT